MLRSLFLTLAFLAFSLSAARADTNSTGSFQQPDLVSFQLGYFDFDKSESHKQSADMRAEYRWGLSMLPLISDYFKKWDPCVQFHPYAGVETNSWGALYGNGGFAMDAYMGRHFVFTWSEGAGLFSPGGMSAMGSYLQFRSQGELGYRFDNEMRVTGEFSHISDAHITRRNPGAEVGGIYLHVPVGMFGG